MENKEIDKNFVCMTYFFIFAKCFYIAHLTHNLKVYGIIGNIQERWQTSVQWILSKVGKCITGVW